MNSVSWLKTLIKRRYTDEDYGSRTKYYCSEYITHVLQEADVVRKDYHPDGYKPWELLYGDMPFMKPHEYGRYFLIGDAHDVDAEVKISTAPSKKKFLHATKPGSIRKIEEHHKPELSEEKKKLLERTREKVRRQNGLPVGLV